MKIDSIQNGVVLDHISAGNGMRLYYDLGLDKLDCSVALIQNVKSRKMGKKDIIKIDKKELDINFDAIGYIDPDVTVSIIRDGVTVEKRKVSLPKEVVNLIRCRNPRCITAIEPNVPQIFRLTDEKNRVYRCIYCETKAGKKN